MDNSLIVLWSDQSVELILAQRILGEQMNRTEEDASTGIQEAD